MAEVGTVAALVLAAVLVVSGAVKLVHRRATASAFTGLGLPAAPLLALAVPVAELVVAVMLTVAPQAGGVSSLVLLTLFTAVVVRALRAGTRAPCACFGVGRTVAVSGVEVVRNALLAGLAVAALFAPRPAPPSFPALVTVSAACVTGFVLVTLAGLRRDAGPLLKTPEVEAAGGGAR